MSTTALADIPQAPPQPSPTQAVLLCLPSVTSDTLELMQASISAAFPGYPVRIATPDGAPGPAGSDNVSLVPYPAGSRPHSGWALTAGDFSAAAELAIVHNAAVTVVLGAESASLSPDAIRLLAETIFSGSVDLALPRYNLGPHDGLLSSAIFYPVTQALFGIEVHLPMPIDAAFSARMAARLRLAARRPAASAESEPLLWPVSEAAIASFSVREVSAGDRTLPSPADLDINTLLADIAGSLFADIESKATYWQRARPVPPHVAPSAACPGFGAVASPAPDDLADIAAMAESFRNAFINLQEIWSLVLPPQSLLALKKVSRTPPEAFDLPANLWARTVYDFVLAYHLRTINRGHLLGAFTPLYLAWVAGHLRRSSGDLALAARHVEETAAAFTAEKPYIVSRWRWPDRFNP